MDHYGELLKQGKVDRVRDRLVASVVRMQMITRRKVRHQTAGMLRVAHDRVEVDDPVKRTAATDACRIASFDSE